MNNKIIDVSSHMLTGRTRHRMKQRLLRNPLIILQVEVIGEVDNSEPGRVQSRVIEYWRDAEAKDFSNKALHCFKLI